jgi:hypothetical protein
MRMERVLGGRLIVIREIIQEGVNKSNHPIQNPLLLFTEPRPRDNLFTCFSNIVNLAMDPARNVAKACTTPVVLGILSLMSGVMPSTKLYSVSKG